MFIGSACWALFGATTLEASLARLKASLAESAQADEQEAVKAAS